MTLDAYHRRVFNEKELCEILYNNPDEQLKEYRLNDNRQYQQAIKQNFSSVEMIDILPDIDLDVHKWHKQNQSIWHMPDEYKNLNVAEWVLSKCNNDEEVQRCGQELLEYAERDMLEMLCYLKYLVDTMTENSIVWGVGRGSSVSSFVLYIIGVHRINSLYYELDFNEFMR
jgi:DNA polymerase III alpha subunit